MPTKFSDRSIPRASAPRAAAAPAIVPGPLHTSSIALPEPTPAASSNGAAVCAVTRAHERS